MAEQTARPSRGKSDATDMITYEVIRNRLSAIVAQQSLVLRNVSGSPLVTEANDCNTGLYLPNGEIVAMGPHNIFHSGSMEQVTANIMAAFSASGGINEGDVFITNDPYKGALHMPDVTMLQPVFVEGEHIGWVGSCAHVLDIGGMTPSSWCPDATQVYQEGLCLPPTKLVDRGETREDVWNLILTASRLPANLGLDLKAMIASNNHARNGLVRLVERYGAEEVTWAMRTMLDWSEERVRERLLTLPDGVYRARNYFDHDGRAENLLRVAVEVTKNGDMLRFDYSDSSDQMPGIYNCTMSGLRGGVFASLLPVIAHDIPWNSGIMRCIHVHSPEGKVVNSAHPCPCGASTIGAAQLVQSTASITVSQLVSADARLRHEAMAGTTGAIPVLHMGGINQYGHRFGGANTDILAGGGGATFGGNGVDVAGPHEMLSYKFNNVEGEESHFPLLWLRRSLSEDSGGAGRNQGGAALSSSIVLHDAKFLHGVLMGHSLSMPSTPGLHGGMPGATISVRIGRGTNVEAALNAGGRVEGVDDVVGDITDYTGVPGEVMLFPGDVLDWSFHGGGGWGDALDADPEGVMASVRAGRISRDGARSRFGVVLAGDIVDHAATEIARAATGPSAAAGPGARPWLRQ